MPSSSLSRFRNAAHNAFKTKVAGRALQATVETITGQAISVIRNCRLLASLPFSTPTYFNILLRPGTTFSDRLDHLVNWKGDFSVEEMLSRTFSTPFVSGSANHIFGDHTVCFLPDPTCSSGDNEKQKFLMSVIAPSEVPFGDSIANRLALRCTASNYNASVLNCRKGSESCISASMSLRNRGQPNHAPIYGYFLYNAVRSSYKFYLNSSVDSRDFHCSSATSLTAGIAPDVTFDRSFQDDKQDNAAATSEEKVAPDRALTLLSGSCYLPHPDKEETGGEDAHFICAEEQAVGVADGVGGWAELGVDAGQYARELMSNSVIAIQEEPKRNVDPARVLEKAHSTTRARGSSTACIVALTDQGLHAVNLGDSGFIVVRDGCTVFRSPVQQHDFNLTYQLESGNGGDLPSCGQVFTIPVAPGDVIIAGTDGLFDNLYNNEVTAVVVHALRAGLEPQVTAQKIAVLARQRAQDRDRQTPFSTAAQDAGFRYYGGKLDDITVVVSYITSRTKEDDSSPSCSS